jgi:hypothetical protein
VTANKNSEITVSDGKYWLYVFSKSAPDSVFHSFGISSAEPSEAVTATAVHESTSPFSTATDVIFSKSLEIRTHFGCLYRSGRFDNLV